MTFPVFHVVENLAIWKRLLSFWAGFICANLERRHITDVRVRDRSISDSIMCHITLDNQLDNYDPLRLCLRSKWRYINTLPFLICQVNQSCPECVNQFLIKLEMVK